MDWSHGFMRWLERTTKRHGSYEEAFKEFDAFEVYQVYRHAQVMRGYWRIDGEIGVTMRVDIAHLYPVSTEWISPLAAWNLVPVPEVFNRALGDKVFRRHCHTGVKKVDGTRIEDVKAWLLTNTNLMQLLRQKELVKRDEGEEDKIYSFKSPCIAIPQSAERLLDMPEDTYSTKNVEQTDTLTNRLLDGTILEDAEPYIQEHLISGSRGRVAAFLERYEADIAKNEQDDGHAAERAYQSVQAQLHKMGGAAMRLAIAEEQQRRGHIFTHPIKGGKNEQIHSTLR
ncbi:hypothetical protein ACHFJ9_12465 [Vibrio sp. D3]|uniref:hypothetical protein n=1 Tax=Vibrio sp. D3 TaxID=3374281 RepID=UPI0037573D0A